MTNTRTRNYRFTTRFIACVLCIITIFSIGTVAMTGASAAVAGNITVVDYNNKTLRYSDDYFRHSSTQYDSHLATLSCIMTHFSMPLDNPTSKDDNTWYQNQPARIRGFFKSIGFNDFEANKDYTSRSSFDTIGVAAANRKVDDCTVIGVGIRSGGYFREWANNVYLGDGSKSDYMHEGWYNAAKKALAFINEYITAKNITGKVKIWIAGFSRGGATANLTAGLLDNMIDKNEKVLPNGATLAHNDLYAYTFEAPQGANYNSKNVKKPGDSIYNNIFNVVNPNDLVPKVAMSQYGFTRFGTDKFITTEFYDPANFKANRNVFKAMYVADNMNWNNYKADTFEMYGTPLKNFASLIAKLTVCLPAGVADTALQIKNGKNPILEKDNTKANYNANIATYLLLDELMKNIGSRDTYCKTYQSGISNFLLAMMNDVNALKKEELYTVLTKVLLTAAASMVPGAKDKMTAILKKALPSDVDSDAVIKAITPLLGAVASVYWNRPNELISVGLYIKEIFQNHETDVNVAHLEAQDSYYIDAYNAKNGANLQPVGLRDTADFCRVTFKDYNDIGLYNNNASKRFVSVKGAKGVKSKVEQCDKGFAVGYYSYATEDGLELFVPVNQNYTLNMKGYSLKPYHTVSYSAFYQSFSPNSAHRVRDSRANFSDWFCGNTSFRQIKLNANF